MWPCSQRTNRTSAASQIPYLCNILDCYWILTLTGLPVTVRIFKTSHVAFKALSYTQSPGFLRLVNTFEHKVRVSCLRHGSWQQSWRWQKERQGSSALLKVYSLNWNLMNRNVFAVMCHIVDVALILQMHIKYASQCVTIPLLLHTDTHTHSCWVYTRPHWAPK